MKDKYMNIHRDAEMECHQVKRIKNALKRKSIPSSRISASSHPFLIMAMMMIIGLMFVQNISAISHKNVLSMSNNHRHYPLLMRIKMIVKDSDDYNDPHKLGVHLDQHGAHSNHSKDHHSSDERNQIKSILNPNYGSHQSKFQSSNVDPAFEAVVLGDDGDDPKGIENILEILALAIPCLIIMFFTIIGNVMVIISVFTYGPLKNVANMYMVSLAVADIAVSVFVMPFNVIYTIRGKWDFGLFLCKGWLTCDILCCTASILNLCAIAIDRYQAIHDPINYASKRTMNRIVVAIGAVWTLSALIAMPPLLGWNDWPDEFTPQTPCTLTSEPGFVIYSSSGTFFIPLVIMTYVYRKIFVATKKRLRKRAQQAQEKINMRSGVHVASAVDHPSSSVGENQSASRRRFSSLGHILKKKGKKSKVKGHQQASPSNVLQIHDEVHSFEEISMVPRQSTSNEDNDGPDVSECPKIKTGQRLIIKGGGQAVKVTINRASDDPPTSSASSENEDKDLELKGGDKRGADDEVMRKRGEKEGDKDPKDCSRLSLTSGKDDPENGALKDGKQTRRTSSLQDIKTDDDDGHVQVVVDVSTPSAAAAQQAVPKKSLLKTPSFGMASKKKPETSRFMRNNNNNSSGEGKKHSTSSKSVHIHIVDDAPSIMNVASTSSASGTSSTRSCSLVPGTAVTGNSASTTSCGAGGNYSSSGASTNNYVSGNATSASSLCPPSGPATGGSGARSPSDATSTSTSTQQVSQIWEEKQRISLSRERKAARVLGIVMGKNLRSRLIASTISASNCINIIVSVSRRSSDEMRRSCPKYILNVDANHILSLVCTSHSLFILEL